MTKRFTTARLFDIRRIRGLWGKFTMQNAVEGFCSQNEFHAILAREKARADRNGHGFSLVAFEVSGKEDISKLVKHLQNILRISDEIGWFANNTLGILLYNTSAVGAWQFVNKNKIKTDDIFSLYNCSVYSYPNDWCSF